MKAEKKQTALLSKLVPLGVKLQEYVNYLNWSGDGFLDNQFDQAADRVTHVAARGNQTGSLRN